MRKKRENEREREKRITTDECNLLLLPKIQPKQADRSKPKKRVSSSFFTSARTEKKVR